MPAVESDIYLTEQSNKRRVKVKSYTDCLTSNILDRHASNNTRSYIIPFANTEQYKHSFFVETLVNWNHLDDSVVHASTVEGFKQALPQRY